MCLYKIGFAAEPPLYLTVCYESGLHDIINSMHYDFKEAGLCEIEKKGLVCLNF